QTAVEQLAEQVAQEVPLTGHRRNVDGHRPVGAVIQVDVQPQERQVQRSEFQVQDRARVLDVDVGDRRQDCLQELVQGAVQQVDQPGVQRGELSACQPRQDHGPGQRIDQAQTGEDLIEREAALQQVPHGAEQVPQQPAAGEGGDPQADG